MSEDEKFNPVDDEIHAKRAAEERNRARNNDAYKKVWDAHQNDEYLKVNNYKEAVCYGCFKKDICTATLVDICPKCASKKGREAMLAQTIKKFYGYCYFCGTCQFDIWQINVRLCLNKCNRQIRKNLTNYNMKGGMTGVDPFWIKQRKKNGKDWWQIFARGWTRK